MVSESAAATPDRSRSLRLLINDTVDAILGIGLQEGIVKNKRRTNDNNTPSASEESQVQGEEREGGTGGGTGGDVATAVPTTSPTSTPLFGLRLLAAQTPGTSPVASPGHSLRSTADGMTLEATGTASTTVAATTTTVTATDTSGATGGSIDNGDTSNMCTDDSVVVVAVLEEEEEEEEEIGAGTIPPEKFRAKGTISGEEIACEGKTSYGVPDFGSREPSLRNPVEYMEIGPDAVTTTSSTAAFAALPDAAADTVVTTTTNMTEPSAADTAEDAKFSAPPSSLAAIRARMKVLAREIRAFDDGYEREQGRRPAKADRRPIHAQLREYKKLRAARDGVANTTATTTATTTRPIQQPPLNSGNAIGDGDTLGTTLDMGMTFQLQQPTPTPRTPLPAATTATTAAVTAALMATAVPTKMTEVQAVHSCTTSTTAAGAAGAIDAKGSQGNGGNSNVLSSHGTIETVEPSEVRWSADDVELRLESWRRSNKRVSDIELMSSADIVEERRELKRILSAAEACFARTQGRAPKHDDRGALRPYYRRYKLLRQRAQSSSVLLAATSSRVG